MPLVKRYTFTTGARLSSSQLNTNFDDLYNTYNTHTHTGQGNDALQISASGIAPGGSLVASTFTSPVKFNVYRNAAQTPGTGNRVQFDTTVFDTGNNVDVTTNKGRFTVPISGFYQLNAQLVFTTTGANQDAGIIINKNGSQVNFGNTAVNMYAGVTSPGVTVSIFIQLVAGDYIEVAARSNLALSVGSSTQNVFSGYLVSVG